MKYPYGKRKPGKAALNPIKGSIFYPQIRKGTKHKTLIFISESGRTVVSARTSDSGVPGSNLVRGRPP